MFTQTRDDDLVLFANISKVPQFHRPDDVPSSLLTPATVTSELKTACQIDFLILILNPILVIHLVIATRLMALGMLMGVVPVGRTEIYPDCDLAINPGRVFGTLQGIETGDPAFGLEAIWIPPAERDSARTLSYSMVDASRVVATYLCARLQRYVHELIGHEEVQ